MEMENKMLKHDLKLGIIKYTWVYIIIGLLVFWGISYFYYVQQQDMTFLDETWPVTGFSMLIYIFQGNEKYVPNPGNEFQLHIIWLLPLLLIGYVIYAYPFNDLKMYGYNYMIRTKSRARWWFAKFVWLLIHCLVCIVVMAGTACLCAWIHGEPMFEMPGMDILEALSLPGLYEMDLKCLMLICVLMFLTIVALSALQLLCSFVLNPLAAYIGIIVLYVTSVYFTTWLLPGNYLMLIRMEVITGDCINQWIGFPYMGIVLIAALFDGRSYMKRYDIL